MLKICKSCKALVDTNKHDFCPKCGANFNFDERTKLDVSLHNEMQRVDEQFAQQRRNAVESQMKPPKEAKPKHDPYKYDSHSYNNDIPEQTFTYTQPEPQKPAQPVTSVPEAPKPQQVKQLTNYKSAQHSAPQNFEPPMQEFPKNNTYSYSKNKQNKKGCGIVGCITFVFTFFAIIPTLFGIAGEVIEEFTVEPVREETAIPAVSIDWDEITMPDISLPENIVTDSADDYYEDEYSLFECNSKDDILLSCYGVKRGKSLLNEPAEGNMFVSFNLGVLNCGTSSTSVFTYPVCYADGIAANMCTATEDGLYLPGQIPSLEEYVNYACFEVPENTKEFMIEYLGITIIIENPLQPLEGSGYTDVEMYEFAYIDNLTFACSGIDIPLYMAEQPKKEGYDYILLEFYAMNESEEIVYNQDIPQCYVGGELMEINYDIKDEVFFIGELNPTEGTRGYVCYEIPTDTPQLEIIFAEKVRITIDGPFFA